MLSVLLVDDEPETLELIPPYLESKGFTVWAAPDGDKALALINQHHPNVVLLDVNPNFRRKMVDLVASPTEGRVKKSKM